MINEKAYALGSKSSVIREIFEYGKKRKSEIGEENVFDFSIGNPSVPCPKIVTESLSELINNSDPVSLHGYTSAPGDINVRKAIANYVNDTFGVNEKAENIFLTAGAAASLTVSLNAIVNEGDEVIVFAPFFPEYRVFAEKAGAALRVVKCSPPLFQPDLCELEKAVNEKTKAIIINSPNNPTGAVMSADTVEKISALLRRKEKELGSQIFIISDEPYRELIYSDKEVPYITKYYDDSIVCYSFSKSLSLPGERIGYILVSDKCKNAREVYFAICGAARSLGFVCAPALFQYIIPRCLGKTSDISVYKENRDILYNALTSFGYEVVYPDGAFYLFVKALEDDDEAFAKKARKHELLIVPSKDFGFGGYVRISYCVSTDTVKRSLDSFKKLYDEYGETKNG